MEQKTYKVIKMLPMQQGSTERGQWRSQDIIIESTENVQYPDCFLLRFSGAAVDRLEGISEGMKVYAQWSASVRQFKTRNGDEGFAQELRCWKIEPATEATSSI